MCVCVCVCTCWRTVKSETEKVNDLYTNIPASDITELNELIYAGEKLVSEKIGVPLKITNRKSKPGWELRLELQIKRLRQNARILKRNIKKVSEETEKARQRELKKTLRRPTKKYWCCCIAVIQLYVYIYTCRNIINNNDERTHFF